MKMDQNMNYLRRIDLNHLVTLQALLAEKHISRAAIRLNKSQPAVSHSLAYLRKVFDDPLLVRKSRNLELTPKAEELVQPLEEALSQLTTLFEPPKFEPAHTDRTFRIAMSDYGSSVILPRLLPQLRSLAPKLKLVVTQSSRESMIASIIDGECDLAFGVFHEISTEIQSKTLFEESFISLADQKTMSDSREMDLSEWLSRPHLLVSLREGSNNEIEYALNKMGHKREIFMVLPHWGIAGDLIEGTDLILTVAAKALNTIKNSENLVMFKPPFNIDSFNFDAIWHKRKNSDPAHIWLRNLIETTIIT